MRPVMNAQDCLADQPVRSTFVDAMDFVAATCKRFKEEAEENSNRVTRQLLKQAADERRKEATTERRRQAQQVKLLRQEAVEREEKLRQEAAQAAEKAMRLKRQLEQEADERKEDTQALRQQAAQAAEKAMRRERQLEQHAARLRLLDQHEFAYSTRCALIQALCIAIVRHNAEEETKLSVPGQHGREDMVEAVARLTSPEAVEATVVKSHGAEEDRRKQVSFATAALGRHILNAFRDGSASSFPPWVATVCAHMLCCRGQRGLVAGVGCVKRPRVGSSHGHGQGQAPGSRCHLGPV